MFNQELYIQQQYGFKSYKQYLKRNDSNMVTPGEAIPKSCNEK